MHIEVDGDGLTYIRYLADSEIDDSDIQSESDVPQNNDKHDATRQLTGTHADDLDNVQKLIVMDKKIAK